METRLSDDKKKKLAPASEDFWDAVISEGTSRPIECEHCGLIHFSCDASMNKNNAFESDDENKGFLADVIANPDKYHYHDSDSVSFGYVGGLQTPYNCPCNLAGMYEGVFWSHRLLISDYFINRARTMIDDAKGEKRIADDVETVLVILEEKRAKRRADF